MEIWKKIKGFENYEVSSYGMVKSLYFKKEKILKFNISNAGYKYVVLSNKSKKKTFNIHRLVALNFLNNFNNKKCVNHINENKLDNNVLNLEWCTYSENRKHSLNTGTYKNVSENHHNCKLSKLQVIKILKLIREKKHTQLQISKIFNINQSTVSDIKTKKIRNKYE
jgi:predicted XRE-type DNA-binding protein